MRRTSIGLAALVALVALVAFAAGVRPGCGSAPELYAGMPEHVQRRHVRLEGAPNFRDLGGYATGDGHTVRWGLFFRSDNLAHLSDADLEKVEALGIRLVCDFRGADERAEEPDRLPAVRPPAVAELEISDASFSSTALRERIASGDLDGVDLRQLLIDANRLFAGRFAPQYAAMFERITRRENLPALVHCTAGKDRAGFASALILRTLGVPMETVSEDFLLTNHYTAAKIERTLLVIRVVSLFRADPERVRPVLGVEPAFLEAAFGEIDARWGSFDRYRREALGLDDDRLAAFRELALE
jgi:protein-tyrosine phosphatase